MAALPDLPYSDDAFDAVTANFVINHVPDPRAAVTELARVGRVGARVAITIWPAGTTAVNQLWDDLIDTAGAIGPPAARLEPTVDFDRTEQGLADLLAQAGLTDVGARTVEWTFSVAASALWSAVEAGIAGIGATYLAQSAEIRSRMRQAYTEHTDRVGRAGCSSCRRRRCWRQPRSGRLSHARSRVVRVSTSTDPERLLDALDPEQREVATTVHGPVAVIAGAGTGKTRAITHRIAYGVAVGAYQANTVLAVTFTTRAAGEMRGRLQQLGVRSAQARTFHSAALRQAQYFWPRVHGSQLPMIADNRMGMVAEAASRLRVGTDTGTLRDLVGEIGWSKVSNVDPDDYVRVAQTQHRELASVDAATVARVFTGYEKVKTDRGRIDFEDILLCAVALLSDHDDVRTEVHRTYRHFVVDEYQDVSPLQQTLLDLWRGERSDVCVVGDPAQTIHSFAGARADYLTGFPRRHRDATVIRLVRDYRSTPQVVDVANKVMAGPPGSDGRVGGGSAGIQAVRLMAQRPDGPQVDFAESPDEADEAAAVAEWCAARHAGGTDWRELAVLFRINAQSPSFEQALTERGVPYLVRSGERFYERPEVRQAIIALRAEANNDPDRPATQGVRIVLDALGWTENAPTGAGATRERWESLAALVTVAEDLAEEAGMAAPPTLADVVAELERRAQAQHVPVAQGVTLSTLHSAKGLEWDGVALVGIQEGTLPFSLATTPVEIAEERRLLYVGVTRAREHLRISWSRRRSGSGGQRNASRFLTGIRPQTTAVTESGAAGSARRKPKQSVLSARCRTCNQLLTDAAERKLGRHTDCPATYDERTLELLKEWRKQEATEQDLPAYCIFTDATLIAIAEARPDSSRELIKVHGLGKTKLDKYGEHVLTIVASGTASDASP